GYSYVWTPGGQLTQCVNVGAGTYGVTIEDANGCQLELDPVEVVELPLPNANISGPAVICDAGCVYLSVPYVSGNSYQWLDDNLNPIPFEIYNQIYVCDYNLLPSYSVIVTDQNGCSVQSAPHVISLALSPDVSVTISPMPCAGQPVTLTATSSFDPNISYVWSNGGTGNTITVTQAGDYTVVATNTITGCSSNETVTIFPLPDFCILPQGCYEVCNPDTVCGPPGLASYQWNLNGNPITGETSQCLIVTQDGTYTLTGTTVNGCTDTSADLVLTVIDCSSLCDSLILDHAFLTDADGNVDSCCVSLSYTNNYGPLQGISISTNDADLNVNLGSIDPLLTVQSITANTLQLASITTGSPIPSGTLSNFVEFCLSNVINSPQTIVIDWYDFENAIVCSDTITMHCAVEPDCAYVASDSIYCENGEITYQFTVCNPVDADFSIGFINLIPSSPAGIVIIPPFIDVTATPILPGTCQTFTVNLTGSGIEGQTFCYNLIAHQENPLIADSVICCSIDTTYCIDIPICDPCLFTSVVGVTPSDESDCCYDVTLINGNIPGVFSSIGVNVISPSTTMTVNNPFGSGWTTTGFTGTSATFVPGPLFGNTVPTGTFTIPQICIQTNIAPTQQIEITWNDGDVVLCRDTIDVFCEPPCGYLVNELIECDPVTGQWNYSAAIQNTTGYTVTHALFNFYSPGGMGAYDVTIPLGSVLPNTTSPIFNLTLGAPAVSGDVVCFTVTLIKQNSDGTDVNCCYFDDCITLPDCIVDPGCQCDEAFYMAVAQGITYTPSSLGANTYDFQLTGWAALDNCDIVRWKWGHVTPITTSAGPDVVTHTFPGPGTYDVCVKVVRTAADGTVCTASVCVTLVIPLVPAGMVELPGDLVLFPNPSTGIFKIQVEDYVTYPLQLTVFDNLQQPVKSLLVPEQPRGGILEMDLSHHAKGVYYIQFLSGDVVITQPVIIY
ncbi:MAG: hypothetical protein JNM00_02985, partial [Flavobacteriales bacterium]|nr:hypothetical protein [Flavobacteriales bacterium]